MYEPDDDFNRGDEKNWTMSVLSSNLYNKKNPQFHLPKSPYAHDLSVQHAIQCSAVILDSLESRQHRAHRRMVHQRQLVWLNHVSDWNCVPLCDHAAVVSSRTPSPHSQLNSALKDVGPLSVSRLQSSSSLSSSSISISSSESSSEITSTSSTASKAVREDISCNQSLMLDP